MTVLASRTWDLVHEVSARHATTGAAVPVRAAFAGRAPVGYVLRVAGSAVAVSRDTAHEPPAEPVVLLLTAADTALRLAAPEAELRLTGPELVHEFAPLPSAVEVVLRQQDGAPLPGRAVVVRGTDGTDVPLAEEPAGSGTHRAERTWGAAFARLDLRVGGRSARQLRYDPTVRVQRIRLTAPA